LIDFLSKQVLKINFVCFSIYFFVYFFVDFDISCNALICIQNLKKNKNKNKNKLSTKTKKTKLKQIVSRFIVDLDWTSSRNSFTKFYNFVTKSFRDFELLARSSSSNIINFYFIFVRVSLTYTSIENRKRENIYK